MTMHELLDWGKFIIGILGGVVGFLGAWTAFFIRYSKLEKSVVEHDLSIAEVHTLIEEFHGKCDNVTGQLNLTISRKMLEDHCEKHQQKCTASLCRKIAEVREDVKDLRDDNKKTASSLVRIEHFMGKMEGMFLRGQATINGKQSE